MTVPAISPDQTVTVTPESVGLASVDPAVARGKGGMAQLTPGLKAVAFAARTLDALAPALATRLMLRHFTRPRRKRKVDYRSQLPPGVRQSVVAFGDRDVNLWCWGDSGPTVLLVHGWEDHSGSMLPFVLPLQQIGYRVVAVDAPGHGFSSAGPTHLLDSSRALERVIAEHGPFEGIVAHSFGATAVCHMLSQLHEFWHPRRMALISPMRDMEQHLEIFADIALLSPQRMDRLRKLAADVVGCPLDRVSAFSLLDQLSIPGLVIHDQHDPVIPHAVSERVAQTWTGVHFFSTRKLGHRRVLKCPEVLAEVINLLGNGSADGRS